MKYLSLFSGIGGFEYALASFNRSPNGREQTGAPPHAKDGKRLVASTRQATTNTPERGSRSVANQSQSRAFTCVGYSEIDTHAVAIYHRHFPGHTNYGDIKKINAATLPDFDLLVGGFPCQAFSIAGLRRGFSDTRGTLFFDIARIVKEKQPRLLLLENVKGLLSHDAGRTFLTIITTLDELGYDCQWQVLNSKNHGVPQNRERVFIVGHLRGTPRPQIFPLTQSNKIPTKKSARQTQATHPIRAGYKAGQGGNDYIIHNIYGGFKEKKAREFRKYSPTIRTPQGGGHIPSVVSNAKIRRLTPLECERLQGFPDEWTEGISDTQRYKCLGNAVTTTVVKAIAARL